MTYQVSSQCASQSIGPANELFGALIQTILSVQCAISPPELWPKDFGPTAMQQGETHQFQFQQQKITIKLNVHFFPECSSAVYSLLFIIELTINVK